MKQGGRLDEARNKHIQEDVYYYKKLTPFSSIQGCIYKQNWETVPAFDGRDLSWRRSDAPAGGEGTRRRSCEFARDPPSRGLITVRICGP